MNRKNYSVSSVHRALVDTLHQYLSAQYHIWDEWLISERNRILNEQGHTHQEPRLEATPQYAEGEDYSRLRIPDEARDILTLASKQPNTGIPPRAYFHQCRAVESFLGGRNLIVSTGTGSGKTETFLLPILSTLAVESSRRSETWRMPGVRALLLYPMNALVNDQLSRLRRLLGDKAVAEELSKPGKRKATFGMYTSRSPYPGLPSKKKSMHRVGDELTKLYLSEMTDEYREQLLKEGKWPAKNLDEFIAGEFRTNSSDVELITRHEMQRQAPDLLVTNYSMLEYMMLRPIEASIFAQTSEWLAADSDNSLLVILDEAHMYRGSGGAEVAYLLRRLQSRLGVSKDKIRFILTSASLGSSEESKSKIKKFAAKLTGSDEAKFELITGKLDQRSPGMVADPNSQIALSQFDYGLLLDALTDVKVVATALEDLARKLSIRIDSPSLEREGLQQFTFELLCRLPVASLVAKQLTAGSMTISSCAAHAFPLVDGRAPAIEALLALMSFGKDKAKNRPFCSIRSHLFFRGLPGLYACSNANCGRASGSDSRKLLGRLHPTSRLSCNSCGARVYELLTHRSCGAAYLRAYMQGLDGDFLWHEPSTGAWSDSQLTEAQFYVIPDRDIETVDGNVVWLHTPTGKLVAQAPADRDKSHYLALQRPDMGTRDRGKTVWSLKGDCPACGQRTRPDAPLAMDLATKGEAPFAHIVRAQVEAQPIIRAPTSQAPNGGRKTLIFSDGRQKAARLARDIPREIELDVFRQVLFMAARELQGINREPKLNNHIYAAFLKCLQEHNLRFFDGDDRDKVESHLRDFQRFSDGDLQTALDDAPTPTPSFSAILLKQLGTPFYSVSALTLGYVAPTKSARARILSELNEVPSAEVDSISVSWIQRLLTKFAFNMDLAAGVRQQASRYPLKPASAIDGFSKLQREFLLSNGINPDRVAKCLAANLSEGIGGAIYLRPSHLILRTALADLWAQCENCKTISPALLFGACPNCTSTQVSLVDPETTGYLRARKGFWRDPVVRATSHATSPMSIDVQEHSAQLSYKDTDNPSPTTEVFERRFRDILRSSERAVDVLSCTTTMEVGIDIGSLIAVAMRNIPPMRQNYQQRAGRAGRRGAAVSTVVTYAQMSAHDSYYFLNPERMLTGDPPEPVLDTTNSYIAVRHVFAQLLQDFFRPLAEMSGSSDIYTVLGGTWDFFKTDAVASFSAFKVWVNQSEDGRDSLRRAQSWLPEGMYADQVAKNMIAKLESREPASIDGLETTLIEFLFNCGLLPSYAFPTDICSLQIQESAPDKPGGFRVVEQAQQGLSIALSEYAPGRLVVLNKKTYRIGTVSASGLDSEVNRAEALFRHARVYRHCTQCSFTAGFIAGDDGHTTCPQCRADSLRTMSVITPEIVFPQGRREINEFDDEQIYSQTSQAQLPLPDEERRLRTVPFGNRGGVVKRGQQRLIVVNEGDPDASDAGFRVCIKCGKVLAEDDSEGQHSRDYYIRSSGPPYPQRCDGEFRRVFLGYAFTSDILLLRIELVKPLRFSVTTRRDRRPLEDALKTLCEALTLSIGRVLDIDPHEVNAGYRFGNDGQSDFADIFLYDTLSGGGGYALQASESFMDIFIGAKNLLTDCKCSTSCENCLRRYANRFNHSDLDRQLGIDLANYIEFGEVPAAFSIGKQVQELAPLIELVRLAGWSLVIGNRGVEVAHAGRRFKLSACPSLRASQHSAIVAGTTHLTFTPYELARDLPSAFAELK